MLGLEGLSAPVLLFYSTSCSTQLTCYKSTKVCI